MIVVPRMARLASAMVEYMAEQLIRVAQPTDGPEIARLPWAAHRVAYRDRLPAGFLAGLTLADRERRCRASLADPAQPRSGCSL